MQRTPVFVITAEPQGQRMRALVPELHRIFANVTIVLATIGSRDAAGILAPARRLSLGSEVRKVATRGYPSATDGEVGCAVSHIRTLHAAWLSGAAAALVLEDDATPELAHPAWRADGIDGLVDSLPPYWDVVQTTLHYRSPGELRLLLRSWVGMHPPIMKRAKWLWPWSTGSYLVSRKAMEEILLNRLRLGNTPAPSLQLDPVVLGQMVPIDHEENRFGIYHLRQSYIATPPLFTDAFFYGSGASYIKEAAGSQAKVMKQRRFHMTSANFTLAWIHQERTRKRRLAPAKKECRPFEHVVNMQRAYDAALGPHLQGVRRAAILDFPFHNNVGDSAIFAGEARYLQLRGVELAFVCDLQSCSLDQLQRTLPPGEDVAILFHGGGNVGDLWQTHEVFRLRTVPQLFLRGYRRLILMPQSVHYAAGSSMKASPILQRTWAYMGVSAANGARLVVAMRDHRSFQFALDHLCSHNSVQRCKEQFLLVPDSAIWLAPLRRHSCMMACSRNAFSLCRRGRGPARLCWNGQDVAWLARTDKEKAASTGKNASSSTRGQMNVSKFDWIQNGPKQRPGRAYNSSNVAAWLERANAEVWRGMDLLEHGRAVLTDRLHGHLLSLIHQLPHCVMNNENGKVFDYMDTWEKLCSVQKRTVSRASTVAEGLRKAQAMANRAAEEEETYATSIFRGVGTM